MSVLYVLVVVALVMVIGAVIAFVWSVRHGQFDDLDTPAVRMLHGDSQESAHDRRRAAGDEVSRFNR